MLLGFGGADFASLFQFPDELAHHNLRGAAHALSDRLKHHTEHTCDGDSHSIVLGRDVPVAGVGRACTRRCARWSRCRRFAWSVTRHGDHNGSACGVPEIHRESEIRVQHLGRVDPHVTIGSHGHLIGRGREMRACRGGRGGHLEGQVSPDQVQDVGGAPKAEGQREGVHHVPVTPVCSISQTRLHHGLIRMFRPRSQSPGHTHAQARVTQRHFQQVAAAQLPEHRQARHPVLGQLGIGS